MNISNTIRRIFSLTNKPSTPIHTITKTKKQPAIEALQVSDKNNKESRPITAFSEKMPQLLSDSKTAESPLISIILIVYNRGIILF